MNELLGFILILVLLGCWIYVVCTVWEFVVEIPKQLKRIADALERKNRYGN